MVQYEPLLGLRPHLRATTGVNVARGSDGEKEAREGGGEVKERAGHAYHQ
jgi:hypothetical protein